MSANSRLILEEISENDIDGLFHCYANPKLMERFGHPPIESKTEALDIIRKNEQMKEQNTGIRYIAKHKETGEFIGFITLKRYSNIHHRAEIDYIVLTEFQGKGFASEMLRLFLKKVFAEWNLERITAYVDLDNDQSYRLLEKANFQKEGILRSWVRDGDSYYDVYSYSFISSDLQT